MRAKSWVRLRYWKDIVTTSKLFLKILEEEEEIVRSKGTRKDRRRSYGLLGLLHDNALRERIVIFPKFS